MKNKDIKQFYDNILSSNYSNDYEYRRWFQTSEKRAGYFSTKETLEKILKKYQIEYSSYLELGPGYGTWTKFFLKKDLKMDFVDISKEMLKNLKERYKENPQNRFFCNDFLEFNSDMVYDLFFSSRAIEYFDDKDKLIEKIYSILKIGGVGIVVTKLPHYKRVKLFRRNLTNVHQLQIGIPELSKLLKKQGFEIIGVYGTTFVFPILRIGILDRFLYKIFSPFPLNIISSMFTESYTVVFKKV